MNDINKLKKMIDESNNIVVFTGAGVSTDSGLKDFRSSDGIYNIKLDLVDMVTGFLYFIRSFKMCGINLYAFSIG